MGGHMPTAVAAWLLTEEGTVDGVLGDRVADCGDSIWTLPVSHWTLRAEFKAEGDFGFIAPDGSLSKYFIYHMKTGELLQPDLIPQHSNTPWRHFDGPSRGRDYLSFYNLSQNNVPPDSGLRTSSITMCEEWVKDPEGRHRLWVPIKWRTSWDLADWCYDMAVQWSMISGRSVFVKF